MAKEYVEIAKKMLDTLEIPGLLQARLFRIDELITLCPSALDYSEPHLRSRQVVAMVVEQWEREQNT